MLLNRKIWIVFISLISIFSMSFFAIYAKEVNKDTLIVLFTAGKIFLVSCIIYAFFYMLIKVSLTLHESKMLSRSRFIFAEILRFIFLSLFGYFIGSSI